LVDSDKSSARDGDTSHPIGVSPGRVVGPAFRMPDPIAEPDPTLRIPDTERSAAVARLTTAAACSRAAA
jgi:hypothetical protein